MTCTSRNLLTEIACSLPNLKMLRLERVVPWLSDDDLLLFSQSCTGLQSLSLLGCQRLTHRESFTFYCLKRCVVAENTEDELSLLVQLVFTFERSDTIRDQDHKI